MELSLSRMRNLQDFHLETMGGPRGFVPPPFHLLRSIRKPPSLRLFKLSVRVLKTEPPVPEYQRSWDELVEVLCTEHFSLLEKVQVWLYRLTEDHESRWTWKSVKLMVQKNSGGTEKSWSLSIVDGWGNCSETPHGSWVLRAGLAHESRPFPLGPGLEAETEA